MPFRVSIFDLTAAVIVLVVVILPPRDFTVSHAYVAGGGDLQEIARYQARLAVAPGDVEAASKLAEFMTDEGLSDWALQVAAEAARRSETESWRALLAVAIAHTERVEIGLAHKYAQLALAECTRLGPELCPRDQKVRISIYSNQLEVGVKSGIDPRLDPRAYERAVMQQMRIIRVRGATPDEPSSQQ